MVITRNQQKEKYLHDVCYHVSSDNFNQSINNRYSLRNYHGLYFDMKKITEFIKMLNNEKIRLKDKKILDIGCYYGLYSNLFAYLKQNSDGVYGIDFIPAYLKKAKDINPGIHFIEGDVYELPFKNNFFDIILCSYVFNAIPYGDLSRVTKLVSSKLKHKGYILFFDLYDSWIINAINYVRGGPLRKEERLSSFNRKIIERLFSDFKIIKSKKMINIFRFTLLLKFKAPYWLLDFLDLILPHDYYMALLQKK